MSKELFADLPFNLAGELLDNSPTAEGEARARAQAKAEARKAQSTLDLKTSQYIDNEQEPGLNPTTRKTQTNDKTND